MGQLTLIMPDAEPTESADERLSGLLYNALYMLEWQISRAQSGAWDAYTTRLLQAGLNTAQGILANGRTFGRYGRPEIETLCQQARMLLAIAERMVA